MRFDKTFIAIRERSILEIFDLALHVLTDHFKPLCWLLVIGAVPWIVIDLYVAGWMLDSDQHRGSYYWVMLLLIVSQTQVGTIFMTAYLGRAMFVGQPKIWSTVKEVFKTTPYYVWSQGVLRMSILTIASCFLISEFDASSSIMAIFVILPGTVGIGLIVRAFRPFVTEILLLERTPLSNKNEKQVNFSRRSKALHLSGSSDLFARFMTSSLLALPLGFACFSLFVLLDSIFNIRSNLEFSVSPYYWIAALWLVAGFICVVRFLSYIDTRIRQEGWSVELRMRAEGQMLLDAIE